ncbi:MAG: hypothetical protein R3C56_23465 [Pirellulaceae bacterium]
MLFSAKHGSCKSPHVGDGFDDLRCRSPWNARAQEATTPADDAIEQPAEEPSDERLPKLTDKQITEITQAGDRLVDQGDYQALEKYTRAYQGVVTRLRGQSFLRAVQPSIFNRQQLGSKCSS